MPKKTKKDKIAAETRKRLKLLAALTYSESAPIAISSSKKTENVTKEKKINTDLTAQTKEDKEISRYFLQDLRKSLFLIALVIALEIAIYFGTINNYLGWIVKL